MTDATPDTPRRRPRPRFRPLEVVAVDRPAPRLVRVSLGGPALEGFRIEAPTQHVKVLFPGPGERDVSVPEPGPDGPVWPADRPRPVMRTYTPRRQGEGGGTLDIELVLHGQGPASEWADQASVGDHLAIAGPGGRLTFGTGPGPWLIAGDESALPAIGTLLDVLPADAVAEVFIEVEDDADEIELPSAATSTVTWLHRRGTNQPSELLAGAVRGASISTDAKVWVACEAAAVRRIRRDLLEAGHVSTDRLVTRGYWRLGEQNHPDHDYGEGE